MPRTFTSSDIRSRNEDCSSLSHRSKPYDYRPSGEDRDSYRRSRGRHYSDLDYRRDETRNSSSRYSPDGRHSADGPAKPSACSLAETSASSAAAIELLKQKYASAQLQMNGMAVASGVNNVADLLAKQASRAVWASDAAALHTASMLLPNLLPPTLVLDQQMALVNMNLAAAMAYQQQQEAQDKLVSSLISQQTSRVLDAAQQRDTPLGRHSPVEEVEGSRGASEGTRDDRAEDRPCSTIIVRGVPSYCDENDIRDEISKYDLCPRDIRMVRRRDGAHRGLVFVEFESVHDAQQWMLATQGVLSLDKDRYQCTLYYSQPRDTKLTPTDWVCAKCGSYNFRRRHSCFRCLSTRSTHSHTISAHPTHSLVIHGLSADCTDSQLLQALSARAPQLPIRSLHTQRHTHTSVCVLTLGSVHEAVQLCRQLQQSPLQVEGGEALAHYCVRGGGDTADTEGCVTAEGATSDSTRHQVASGADTVSSSGSSGGGQETSAMSAEELAEYAARHYATTSEEYDYYLKYYLEYYKSQSHSANEGAAVAQSALKRVHMKSQVASALIQQYSGGAQTARSGTSQPAATDTTAAAIKPQKAVYFDPSAVYAPPDYQNMAYDPTSEYYYSSVTGLYYDAKSGYFYDAASARFYYWDESASRYLPAPQSASSSSSTSAPDAISTTLTAGCETAAEHKQKREDRTKVAKKIAKDMERWARSLNHKRDTGQTSRAAPQDRPSQQQGAAGPAPVTDSCAERGADISAISAVSARRDTQTAPPSGRSTADIGYMLFEAVSVNPSEPSSGADFAYAAAESPSSHSAEEGGEHVDMRRLVCVLCQRAFGTREQLYKHVQRSELHRANLAALEAPSAGEAASLYRDRAAERRLREK